MPGNFLIDPIKFMQQNLVIPSHQQIGVTQTDSGIQTFCLLKSNKPGKQLGKVIDVWTLAKHSSNFNPNDIGAIFNGYWCPYGQNATFTCMLGNDARYMFTATMDGCSFGIGSQPGDGSCRVAHSNEGSFGGNKENVYGMEGARLFQRSEQENRLQHALGNNISIINPLHYMADADGELILKSTTFGYRNGNNWEFYTQKYWKAGLFAPTYFLREVTRQ